MLTRWRALLSYLAAWIAVAVLMGTHTVLVYSAEGPVSASTIRYVAIASFSYWLIWAVVGVVAVLAARRFPVVEKEAWWRNVLVHAALGLVLAGLVLVPYRALRVLGGFPPQLDFAANYVFRLSTGIPTYAIIVGLVSALELRRRARRAQREAAELSGHVTRARLEALQARIRPHFLYNTIHGIQSLVTEDPRRAEDMLGELGTLLRWTTDAPDVDEVPLSRELRVVESYLRMQAERFEERLDVCVDVAPGVAEALVPPLILQPLVENAVEHGMAHRRRGGRIDILARREQGRLTIRVQDDGPGLDEEASARRDGVGLATTRSRLEAQYGTDASVKLRNRPGGGVVATLVLPFRTAPAEVA
ncbi:MAG: sensor histidine kinase [Gemmatimonadota bacterium]